MLLKLLETIANYGRASVPRIVLDPAIKAWALIPIFLVMLLVTLIRQHITAGTAKLPDLATTPAEIKQSSYVRYVQGLLANGTAVPQEHFRLQVAALDSDLRSGKFLADPDAKPPSAFSVTDPRMLEGMVESTRAQVMNYVPQTLLMSWVSSYFGGMVVMRLPFPLPYSFKEMLQAGISAQDLNVRYVSSISWYILLFVGLGSLAQLFSTPEPLARTGLALNHSLLAKVATKQFNPRRFFVQMADTLAMQDRKSVLEGIESRVIAMPLD